LWQIKAVYSISKDLILKGYYTHTSSAIFPNYFYFDRSIRKGGQQTFIPQTYWLCVASVNRCMGLPPLGWLAGISCGILDDVSPVHA